jgi:hypothetical protein
MARQHLVVPRLALHSQLWGRPFQVCLNYAHEKLGILLQLLDPTLIGYCSFPSLCLTGALIHVHPLVVALSCELRFGKLPGWQIPNRGDLTINESRYKNIQTSLALVSLFISIHRTVSQRQLSFPSLLSKSFYSSSETITFSTAALSFLVN